MAFLSGDQVRFDNISWFPVIVCFVCLMYLTCSWHFAVIMPFQADKTCQWEQHIEWELDWTCWQLVASKLAGTEVERAWPEQVEHLHWSWTGCCSDWKDSALGCVEDVTVIVWQSPLPGPTRLYLSLLVCGLYRVTCNSRQAKAASLSVPDSNSWSLKQPLLM